MFFYIMTAELTDYYEHGINKAWIAGQCISYVCVPCRLLIGEVNFYFWYIFQKLKRIFEQDLPIESSVTGSAFQADSTLTAALRLW